MEPLSLLFSVIALAVAGITIIVIIANKAMQQTAVCKTLSKHDGRVTEMDEHLRVSREHMKSVETKLDRMIELLEDSQKST